MGKFPGHPSCPMEIVLADANTADLAYFQAISGSTTHLDVPRGENDNDASNLGPSRNTDLSL